MKNKLLFFEVLNTMDSPPINMFKNSNNNNNNNNNNFIYIK